MAVLWIVRRKNASSLHLDKHRLWAVIATHRVTQPPGAAREDPAPGSYSNVAAGAGRAPGPLSLWRRRKPADTRRLADDDTSPDYTGAMVVGVIHGGSIVLAEKGQGELSWAARMRRRPGMSQVKTITVFTAKSTIIYMF